MSTALQHSIIILDDYQDASSTLADWSKLSHIPITVKREAIPAEQLVEVLQPYSIIHAMRERTNFTAALLEQLPNLRFITTTGMRNRGIDLVAARTLDITVSGTSANGNASTGTCEQTWALILALSRRLIPEYDALRSGGWQTGFATGLAGKQLGLIGVGRLGKQVAAVGRAFGMKVVAWSPNLTDERAEEAGVERAKTLEALMKGSDVVSVHIVHSERTTGLLGAKELGWLKPTAFLVNTSRGPIIDEKALLDISGRIGGVGLDVFDEEPLPKEHPLRSASNVVLSPHMGYVDDTSYVPWWQQTPENILAFLADKPVRVLDPDNPVF
ncbi:D-isomer-specific 2-hydroxyacid dehydrogenase NAD-binding subunit [Leucosporidium creatinivorum]|uniref:D-isomer-specific 2-hydroxyacid dehydrogenase NAD-binding subunit n=1 Tax=Leucosporidium creatinivorum TaxID=106004 RepID=A0A1Y2FPT3_9BASI|nr:D-isomer-specific 2-hydroxyacid dehydrogenase NAD-binding subunit [Leucosporidium creatinivorum]